MSCDCQLILKEKDDDDDDDDEREQNKCINSYAAEPFTSCIPSRLASCDCYRTVQNSPNSMR